MRLVRKRGMSGFHLQRSIFDQTFCSQSRSFCTHHQKFCIGSNSFCIACNSFCIRCRKIAFTTKNTIKEGEVTEVIKSEGFRLRQVS